MTRELEYCCNCEGPTGHAGAGDGSIYCECDEGPFCLECWHLHQCEFKEDIMRDYEVPKF